MTEIADTLAERFSKYGAYVHIAATSQQLKAVIKRGNSYHMLDDDMIESLEFFCNKISRIVNGDPYYKDNWHDIIGYAKLVEDRLDLL